MTEYPPKRAVRFFNTTGPCDPWKHYMLPPADRLVGAQLDRYISDELYWVLHAPRQTGKTTFLKDWARELNGGGEVAACYVSVERCQSVDTSGDSIPNICEAIREYAYAFGLPVPVAETSLPVSMLSSILMNFSKIVAPKPLVVLFDEADVLAGEPLISFLRQLRGGFMKRGVGTFPVSVALVGMRDLRDYITAAKDGVTPNPGSPFNIKSDSVSITNFSKDDVAALFAQRTEETGQTITAEALDYVYELSWGQPWMVNSLFNRATMRILKENDYQTVTRDHIHTARIQMVAARETHLDSLLVRLRDPKIRSMIESIMVGNMDPAITRFNPDIELAMDLGLIRWSNEAGFTISNPIYEEMFDRFLGSGYHDNFPPPSNWKWQKPDGRLDMDSLLREFQRFWRSHSEVWEERSDYTEAFPHLLLTAFLQRLMNSGGRIDRESAAGRGRMDLRVEYLGDRFVIEIKLLRKRDTPEEIREEGLRQIAAYRDKAAPGAPAYLMIFDRRPEAKEKTWDERITWAVEGEIAVVGC